MFITLGILRRLSGENGPGDIRRLSHLLAGTDMTSQPLAGKQDLPRVSAVRDVGMC